MRMALLGLIGLAAAVFAAPADSTEPSNAVRLAGFGGIEVMDLERVARPQPGEGELRVRVHAAGVNPVDAHIRGGHTAGFIDVELPHVPGFDVSGVVESVGPGIDAFRPGDEVFAMLALTRGGAYAEHAIVLASEAAPKPSRLSHAEAASLPLVSLAAWQALFDTGGLSEGQTVLIHGGSGGVGSVAIQLARARGARVIATASAANLELLRSLGADLVIDYRNERFEDAVTNVDLVLDLIGGQTQQRSMQVLRDGGVLVSLVGLEPDSRTPPRGIRAVSILVEPNGAQLQQIASMVEAGTLRAEVSQVLPLARFADAHRQIETGHTRGKIVLQVVE
jgi:NADPH:quinone reductase-like Zn-dependent oxidoreductase